MKQYTRFWFAWTALPLLAFGCASEKVDPRGETYVDFYSQPPGNLCWDVQDSRAWGREFRTVFSDLKPIEDGVLRLALASGRHHFRVTFLNRVVAAPAEIQIDVQQGKVTPIRVALTEAGSTTVLSKKESRDHTVHGRAGWHTEIKSEQSTAYNVSAVAETPLPYEPKNQMPYARKPNFP
jgi:hypothetical protein